MQKWQKITLRTILGLFLYFGVGYQFAVVSWEVYHSYTTKSPIERKNDPRGFVYRALFPLTAHVIGEGQETLSLQKTEDRIPVATMKKDDYIFWTTILWFFKILSNLVMYVFIVLFNLVVYLVVISYSLVKFLGLLIIAPFTA